MARLSSEFQRFTSLVDRLLGVSKDTLDRRMTDYKERAAQNPNKRGPKPKAKRPSARGVKA
jgi:hypothetical protein